MNRGSLEVPRRERRVQNQRREAIAEGEASDNNHSECLSTPDRSVTYCRLVALTVCNFNLCLSPSMSLRNMVFRNQIVSNVIQQ